MMARPTRWIVSAILLFLVAGVALAAGPALTLGSAPTPTAQVGVPYSSALTASGGTGFYFYSIVAGSGSLPTGLTLNGNTGAITGTPTAAGVFSFQGSASDALSDSPSPATGADVQAAARPRTLAQSGNHAASVSSSFTITVSPVPSVAAGAPTSVWTLCMMMAGLAGAGLFRLRQKRRA